MQACTRTDITRAGSGPQRGQAFVESGCARCGQQLTVATIVPSVGDGQVESKASSTWCLKREVQTCWAVAGMAARPGMAANKLVGTRIERRACDTSTETQWQAAKKHAQSMRRTGGEVGRTRQFVPWPKRSRPADPMEESPPPRSSPSPSWIRSGRRRRRARADGRLGASCRA
ncbi:uncharacterized protein PV09_06958 [Verruconis gallopava]|uniref:Uncharacterized protein n=1 Tax=Verruconis gallopava TaxID=253628 RepID=A0A0D1XHR5_9PEZI|nr:uncharacterized protein PV09_06958 [Verruconis gallopava]KIW01786.1 hypothetical protein PV09_06958 [Verruconis gallopava]